ncbi:MAG TPA: phosphoribosyltransferase family protein [Actinomycetes bacterium]|nr:phosphoribosyltransferase family protein [Actinomycetes bacterium]
MVLVARAALFADRADAGRRLAALLKPLAGPDVVVLGLPRGGVPVAAEVARRLQAPLDVIVVRKLGVPYQPELGMGAIGEGEVRILNSALLQSARVGPRALARVETRERAELDRRTARLRAARRRVPLDGRTALVVDDGLATGFTASAACKVARALGAARVVMAAPVASPEAVQVLRADADEVVCLLVPSEFSAIGQWYDDFSQTSEEEVLALLAEAAAAPAAAPSGRDEEVTLALGQVTLAGHLRVPAGSGAVVVFVHGSGSSRASPRNRYVASVLADAGLATLLLDLLTPEEERERANVFDIELLAARLVEVMAWVRRQADLAGTRVGLFGASTGAAAALWAAAEPSTEVAAIVSRGGRPDLAEPRLADVRAPTLLIVGGADSPVRELNQAAEAELRCERRLVVVPGATHLFEEPGTLQEVARLAREWFLAHLGTEDD